MNAVLKRELGLLLTAAGGLLLLGSAVGHAWLFVISGFMLYLLWHLYNLNRLVTWLSHPSRQVPESWGVWEEVYYQLYNLYKRQRKARKKLTSILSRFQASTEALPYAAVVLNAGNEIEWFNRAAQTLFGLRAGIDNGQRIDNLIRQPVFARYLAAKAFDEPLEFQVNQNNILLNITPYGSGQFLLTARDVTMRRQLDEMRRNFVSNASHELRTPLTVISGYLEMMQEADCDSIRQPLQNVQAQTARMVKIIDELIQLARLESSSDVAEQEQVDVGALLQEVYDEALALDDGTHHIRLTTMPEDSALSLHGRHEELRMALSNLMTNAIRYTPARGSIELFARFDAGVLIIGVKDTGIGIEYEHIPRLTERFYRVDEGRSREQGGTGLGLSIVRHVLDRHGASLHIHSEPGSGSVFECVFDSSRIVSAMS